MRQLRKKQAGFTLIESIVVLSVAVLMLSVPVINIEPVYKQLEEEWFFNELESQLQAMQTFAMVSGSLSLITILPSSREIKFENSSLPSHPLNRRIKLPDDFQLLNKESQTRSEERRVGKECRT